MKRWNGENPWMGLDAYDEGQRLYGRDKETAELADIIVNHTAIVVYGKSGIGKSSLLRAGVFPKLRDQRFVPIYLRLAHNTDVSYVKQIENAILNSTTVIDLLHNDFPDLGLWDFLHRYRFVDSDGAAVTPVVVLDQFEEIFTLTQVDHKPDVQDFFVELTYVLNDVKPDKVLQAEMAYAQSASTKTQISGFTVQSLSKTAVCYEKSPSFRFVIALRDDSLYLLERNSVKIPAIKMNRYNLCALSEAGAMEVILKPCPDLFSESEGKSILENLAYYEYDGYRVVDPAILSLFLFSYYQEQGTLTYADIFERYYVNSTKDIKNSSVFQIENLLLSERGYRNQTPVAELLANGVTENELELLLQRKILKREQHKGVEYVEFSHDRLCEQALKHREARKLQEQVRKMRNRTIAVVAVCIVVVSVIATFFGQYNRYVRAQESFVRSETQRDSVNKLNNRLQQQMLINQSQKDSIAALNASLSDQLQSIGIKNDSLSGLLSFNKRLYGDLKEKTESLERSIIIANAQQTYIENIETKKEMQNSASELERASEINVRRVVDACLSVRNAVDESSLRTANQTLRAADLDYYTSLSCLNDSAICSTSGHFIYEPAFIDHLIAGHDMSNFDYSKNEKSRFRSILASKGKIMKRDLCVKAGQTAVLRSVFIGHSDVAIVAEPGCSLSCRFHDKTKDTWYNGSLFVADYSYMSFDFSTTRTLLDIEVTNPMSKDVSFVIISN